MKLSSFHLFNFSITYSYNAIKYTLITSLFTFILFCKNCNKDIIKRVLYLPIIFVGYIFILNFNYIFLSPLLIVSAIEYWYQSTISLKKNIYIFIYSYLVYIVSIVCSLFILLTYDIQSANIDFIIITCSLMDTYSYIFGKLIGNK